MLWCVLCGVVCAVPQLSLVSSTVLCRVCGERIGVLVRSSAAYERGHSCSRLRLLSAFQLLGKSQSAGFYGGRRGHDRAGHARQPVDGRAGAMEEDGTLRVPGVLDQLPPQGSEPHVRITHAPDSLSLRSAQKRIELLHDVTSIRSSRRPRSTHIPPRKTVWGRFKDGFRSVIAFVFSNVGICVLVLGYLILGAFMFEHLEAENLGVSPVVERRALAVARLWNITERYNTLHKGDWEREVRRVVADYQEEVIEAVDKGFDGQDQPSTLWTFSGALLYSITVITTIGELLEQLQHLKKPYTRCGFFFFAFESLIV